MADRRYTVTFDANINQFTTQVKKAGESFHKFSGNIDADVKKVELGFSGIVKQFTLAKVGIKGLEKGFETFKKIMQSTGSGEDKLAILTAGVETGIQSFYQRLSHAGTGDFNVSLSESINLAQEFQKSLNSFSTLKFSSNIKTLSQDLQIFRLEAMKKMEGANIKDIDKQINELKDEKSKVYSDLGTASGTKFVEKFNAITGLKINKISTLTQLFDPKSSYYIDNIKKAVELAEDEHKIRGRARQEEVNELIRALGYLEAMKKTEFGPALQQIADLTEKQKTELAGYYEGYVGNFQKYYEIQGNINEANKNAAQEEAETKIKAAKNLADFEKKALIERLKIELDAYSDNLYREIVPQARYGSDTGKIQRIQANPELALTAKTTKPAEISRQQFTFEKNPYINDEEIAKYDATQKKMSDLGLAIQINTEKFGAQSQQVQVLQQQLDKLQDPTGFNKMGEGLEQLAGGFDALANSIDSPAMRIAAFSLHLMSGVKAIAAAAGNPFTFIAATASVMASIISFASSMKSQSFATGGIVAPGKSGDQMHVMMNPQEMILNKNQQTRLFNIINQGRPESSPTNNVVFRLEGQQLVGLISNYNKKHA